MPYGKMGSVKKKTSSKSTFKPCRGCPMPAACKRAKSCKAKKR